MPIVGAGVVVLLAIIISTSLTSNAAPSIDIPITAMAGQKIERQTFDYAPLKIQSAPEPVEVIVAAPVPRSKIVRTLEIQTPTIDSQPPIVEVVPVVDPAVSACLGKFVGTLCTFIKDSVAQKGTCMTPGFSPVTCVTHTP